MRPEARVSAYVHSQTTAVPEKSLDSCIGRHLTETAGFGVTEEQGIFVSGAYKLHRLDIAAWSLIHRACEWLFYRQHASISPLS